MGKLTDSELRAWLRARRQIAGKSDGGGLTFTLSKGGTASWVFRYRHGGRAREVTIGNFPDVTLAEARKVATVARAKVDGGIDLAGEKNRVRVSALGAKTFRQIADDYLERAGRELAPRTRAEIYRYLKKDLLPKFGSVPARDISSEQIVQVIEGIGKRSDSVARRAFEALSVIFSNGLARSSLKVNPCLGLVPKSILGPKPSVRPRLKLSIEELRTLFVGLPALGLANALNVKILLATCVRKGELIRCRRDHLVLASGKWWVPDENSKGGSGYYIPLAPVVIEWFKQLIAIGGESVWVLPSRIGRGRVEDRHMNEKTLNAALERTSIGVRAFTPHDLRSTARSHLAAHGVNIVIAERCLNHRIGGLIGIYDQHDYYEERRKALEIWADVLTGAGAEGRVNGVVPLRAAA